jgi:hypothetical protein
VAFEAKAYLYLWIAMHAAGGEHFRSDESLRQLVRFDTSTTSIAKPSGEPLEAGMMAAFWDTDWPIVLLIGTGVFVILAVSGGLKKVVS